MTREALDADAGVIFLFAASAQTTSAIGPFPVIGKTAAFKPTADSRRKSNDQ
jgi:hypothetical protein